MKIKTAKDLKRVYISFFEKKGHKEIPSSPLLPEGDSSTLFISAGMHPLVPYLMGEKHPLGNRLVDVQECVRTGDIDEVGNKTHHTWFEMLGNWSLGDYFKKESINWSLEFLTEVLGLEKEKISVTCFAGDKDAPRDTESAKAWESAGIPSSRIYFFDKKENWWGLETGPCGPDSEIFYDTGKKACGRDCNPSCSCGKYTEIWNNVFMEYEKKKNGQFFPLKQKNVDTGMGVERTLAVILGNDDHYQSPTWQPIVKVLEELSGVSYKEEKNKRMIRIIADHIRASVFIAADGVVPGNKEESYILRRLIRRSIRQGKLLGIKGDFVSKIAEVVLENRSVLAGEYPELTSQNILLVLSEEETKFSRSLTTGLSKLESLLVELGKKKIKTLSGEDSFYLYETFGFPIELIEEEVEKDGFRVDKEGFLEKQKEHQEKSRKASPGRFKGGMLGRSTKEIAHHTVTHLLHRALINVLGDHVSQAGSAVTVEKMRFDFTHLQPLTSEEIETVETLVNKKIREDLPVNMEVMSFKKSQKKGATAFFSDRYPQKVKVYSIGDFSLEVCGGPHVKSTGVLGKFKIIKQDSCGSGKRRIYAKLEME